MLNLAGMERISLEYAVVGVIPGEDYHVYCFCRDGKVRLLDMKPLIPKGGVFEYLRDEAFFRGRLCVIGDTLAWNVSGDQDPYECIDLAPELIYDHGIVVDPPAGIFSTGLRDIPCAIIAAGDGKERLSL